MASLPPQPVEPMVEGLPEDGLRCRLEGGELDCGACRTDGDCPPGQGCAANRQTRRLECMASECAEDEHCAPGSVCRAVTTGNTGAAVVRRCKPAGQRREGQPCDVEPLSPAGSCQEGLRCIRGLCALPCQPATASSCPEGYTCEEGLDGLGCLADCRQLGCAEGQQCKALGDGRFQCMEDVHGECPEVPCAAGERCNRRLSHGRGTFWCARLCSPLHPESCPAGEVCGVGSATRSTCYRRCDPQEPEACGPHQACTSISEDMRLWGCMPRFEP